jgi:hypothetical protein
VVWSGSVKLRSFIESGFTIPSGKSWLIATLGRLLALLSIAFWRDLAQTNGIELILGLIAKSVTQAVLTRAQDFYDSHFSVDLRASGLKRQWAKHMRNVFIDEIPCAVLR